MVRVLIIEKLGNIKCSDFKNFDIEKLYKKANLRKNDNFALRHTWSLNKNDLFVSIYSKNKGRANSENKYDLPPPLDNTLYFGSMILIKHQTKNINNNNVKDISLEEWNKIYEKLFGGFEDLNDNDSYSEEEEIPEHFKTKEGYSKEDGFIVDDDEDLDEDYIPEESEEEAHSSTDSADDEEEIMGEESDIGDTEEDEYEDDEEEEYEDSHSDVGSELSEESYVDSDCN
tara:strand:- start:3163 stop:3849 length:687 start_codon:yes stop_codon:yes gene_type:complete